ncbi:hypothetical protein, partial [Pseudoflavonifractor sp. An85]|uniref:hypothetical protein n=1 Tax=Pseudoflavonifractor sp. An85 TaxID=1965661 RepID=UPI000B57B510
AEEGNGNSDLLAAARSMEQVARKQKNLTIELRQTTKAVADALKEIEAIRSSLHDITSQAQQAALNGVTAAQEKAQEETIKRLDEVSKKNIEYIDALTQESKRRIERLKMVTLPDRLFNFGKWTALFLILIILCHIVWTMMMG